MKLGSIGRLIEALERDGHKPKPRLLGDGRTITAGQFMPGAMGYLLKNRFYVGDVVYKGEIYAGTYEPILPRDLFEAVQSRRQTAGSRES